MYSRNTLEALAGTAVRYKVVGFDWNHLILASLSYAMELLATGRMFEIFNLNILSVSFHFRLLITIAVTLHYNANR